MIDTRASIVDACPTCDAKRLAAFRYCRSCGFDYEAPVDPLADPIVVPPPPPGILVSGSVPAPEGLQGRRIRPHRPWLRQ